MLPGKKLSLSNHLKPGIVVPLMPFLTTDQKYDFPAVEKQIDHYIQAGVAGIFVLTTCGQSPLFSLDENKNLATVVKQTVGRRVPIYVGVGRTKDEPEYTPKMMDHAIALGTDAVVAVCVDRTAEEQRIFFRELDRTQFPVIAYSLGNQQKQLQHLEEIVALDSVIGLKVTIDTRDEQNKKYFQRAIATGKPVFMGEDVVLYDGLELGAKGGVNAVANLIPADVVKLYDRFVQGETAAAKTIQSKINNILLSTLYYGQDYNGNSIDASSALQNAMHQVMKSGSPTMKRPKPTYSGIEQEKIRNALREFAL